MPESNTEIQSPRPAFVLETSITMDVVIVRDSWEARLLEKARYVRREWLKHKRRMLIECDVDGNFHVYQGEPVGRIATG